MAKKSKFGDLRIEDDNFSGLINAFKDLAEPHKNLLNVRHPLYEIITIAVCAVIAGAEGPTAIQV